MDGRHVGAPQQGAGGVLEVRVGADQQDGAKADDEGEDVEVADEAGGIEHRFTGFLGIAHGKEAHQDVGQTGGTEHQGQPKGDGGDGVGD